MPNTYDTNLGVSIYGGASDMAARRGPQGIPLGTPGTYQLPGGRVASEEYKPIAEAQASWDPSSGVSFAQHMKDAGFENPFKEGDTIAGGPATGWSWETMSTPAMDIAAGGTRYYSGLSMEDNLSRMNPAMKQYFQTNPNAPVEYAADPFNFASDRGLTVSTPPMHYDASGNLVPGARYAYGPPGGMDAAAILAANDARNAARAAKIEAAGPEPMFNGHDLGAISHYAAYRDRGLQEGMTPEQIADFDDAVNQAVSANIITTGGQLTNYWKSRYGMI